MKTTIRAEGHKVLVNFDNKAFLEMGTRETRELITGLSRALRRAEEIEEAERLIKEGAICARAGLPFTLSNHPRILDEVRKEAATNRDLRRYMPGGVKAKELVGVPSVWRGERDD